MSGEVTTLSLAVDSTQVKAADQALEKFAATGNKAEGAASALEKSAKNAGAGFSAIAVGSAGAATAAQRTVQANKSAAAGLAETGAQAKLTGYQTAQLSAQLQDFFVQVQAGGSPLTALIQQGSQLSAVFGGFRGAFAAVATVFTPFVIGATAAAGSVAALVTGFVIGEQQSKSLQNALLLTGNAAGLTEGKFNSLAKTLSESTKTGIGSARETLQGLAATGRFSGDALEQASRATQLLAKATGQASADIIKDFASAADGPAKFAEATNRTYNFLTAKQLEYIKTLEDQGRTQDALAETFKLLNSRIEGAANNVGTLERGWNAAKAAVSGYVDAVLSIGRATTVEDAIAGLEEKVKRLRLAASNQGIANPREFLTSLFGGKDFAQQASELEGLLAQLRSGKTVGEALAKQEAERARQQQAGIAFDKLKENSLTRQQQLAKELQRIYDLGTQAGRSPEEIAAQQRAAAEKFNGPGDTSAQQALLKAQLDARLATIQNALKAEQGAYSNAQNVLEALRSAGLVRDGDYYAARRELVQGDAAVQIKALEAEAENVRKAAIVGKDKTDIARQEIERQTKLGQITAEIARVRADATAKTVVLSAQETAAQEAIRKAYVESQAAAQAYLDALIRGQQLDLRGIGQGKQTRDQNKARQQIIDRYESQRLELESQKRTGKITQERYDLELQTIKEFQAKALAAYGEYFDAVRGKQGDFTVGAKEALANYLDEAANVAKQSEDLFSNAFKGAEDALVQFATTGKLDFKSFANSIIADLIRIQIRQSLLKAVGGSEGGGNILGSILGLFVGRGIGTNTTGTSLPTAGGLASGGTAAANTFRPVNERGPELLTVGSRQFLMMGSKSGTVTPNSRLGGSSRTVNAPITINVPGSTDRRTAGQIAAETARSVARASSRNN